MQKINIYSNEFWIPAYTFDEDLPYFEITDEQYELAKQGRLKYINGNVISYTYEQLKNLETISLLKNNLSNTDYKAIKYAEGELTEEEYEETKQQRRKWRDEINELEKSLP